MAGKSTLLRVTALTVLLGHIGSYVPAEWCSLRLVDSICALLGDNTAPELTDSSSFVREVEQVSEMLR